MNRSEEGSGGISSKNPESISQQFRKVVLEKIHSGSLPRGLLIPSERELAEQYKISRASVREGLAQLLAEGILVRGGLRGTFVADAPPRVEAAMPTREQLAFWIAETLFLFVQPGYNQILTGASEYCQERGYNLRFYTVGDRNLRSLLDTPLDNSIQGSIVVGGASPALVEKLRLSSNPLILVDFLTEADIPESIRIDYEAGVELALSHLSDLGHSKIGFIGFPHSRKYDAFWTMLESRGLAFCPRFVEFLDSAGSDSGTVAGFRAMQKILSRKTLPTAIIVTNDCVAIGVMEALAVAKVSVPDQISIVGFDDLAGNSAALTTVRVDLIEVGRLAAQTLIDSVVKQTKPASPIVVPVEMILRSSTSPPPSF